MAPVEWEYRLAPLAPTVALKNTISAGMELFRNPLCLNHLDGTNGDT
jgi:hypothetical protein